jgi:hypothetical protein
MTDIIFEQKDNIKFTQAYHELYGESAKAFPYHSVLFSHEALKGEILNVAQSIKKIEPVVMERYFSEGIEKDELKEMANQMLTFYDNYDSKGEDSEDD